MAKYISVNKDIDAVSLANTMIDRIFSVYGIPDGIVSDRGTVFTSQYWSDICYQSKVKRRLSTAFHPQTDGQTERQNQTLEHYLRVYYNWRQDDWAELLPLAEFAYNDTIYTSIGISLFRALYDFDPRFDCDLEV